MYSLAHSDVMMVRYKLYSDTVNYTDTWTDTARFVTASYNRTISGGPTKGVRGGGGMVSLLENKT